MASTNGTLGNGRASAWIVGILSTLAVAAWTGTVQTVKSSSERIAVLESQIGDTRSKLERIEQKLDHLLDRAKPRGN
jgi:hypothetical protein